MNAKDWTISRIPAYFREKYQLIATVTFTALFSLVFMLVSIPSSHNAWFALGASQATAYTAFFFLIGLLTVILSKRIMYSTRNLFALNYLQYVLWNLGEALLVDLLYTAFSVIGDSLGIIHLEDKSFLRILLNGAVYCFVSLVIPYIIAGMYFAIIDKNNTIRQMNYETLASDIRQRKADRKITLYDNGGTLRMKVSLSKLYYIASEDNYIKVWYTDSAGKLCNYTIRARIRDIEQAFPDGPLVRCNRGHIVNMEKVRILRKEEKSYVADLDLEGIPPIPVTKTFLDRVVGALGDQ